MRFRLSISIIGFLFSLIVCQIPLAHGAEGAVPVDTISSSSVSKVQAIRREGYQSFLEGRMSDAEDAFRYLEVMGSDLDRPEENLAILNRDQSDNDKALAHWRRASLDPTADGFIFNQSGWSYLSAGRLSQAKESFSKAVRRSSSTSQQAEAYLGLGLEALIDSRPKLALDTLSRSLTKSPYLLAVAYDKTGQTELRLGNPAAALASFTRSLSLDTFNFEAMTDLAKLDLKIGKNKDAWILYHRLKFLDPDNLNFTGILKRIEKYLKKNPREIMPERHISRPFLTGDSVQTGNASSSMIRVALFSDAHAKPHTMTRVYFMVNHAFKVIAASDRVIRDQITSYDPWQIVFRSENSLVEVRDTEGNIQYATKEPFQIIPSSGAAGSVLIKSAQFQSVVGFDPGDRELRGAVEVIPNPKGFKLVNVIGIEDYLYGVVGRALGGQSPAEAYDAEAVIARTTALWHKSQGQSNPERSDICDSSACQSYRGVSSEMSRSTKGVRETTGFFLSFQDRVAKVAWHANCGGFTEDGQDYQDPSLHPLVSVVDAPTAIKPPSSPADLERWLHEFPPDSLFSNAAELPQTHSRWARIIPADSIRERVKQDKDIGEILGIRVLKRSKTSRILKLSVIGAKGSLTVEGFSQIQSLLSPGSLRSNLFTITPIQDGAVSRFFILWGSGTGTGLGLCIDGTLGQASLGLHWREILNRYFPNYQIERAYGAPADH
jgi:stage II sporulation protein D